jgi:uncharacterized protein DUF3892
MANRIVCVETEHPHRHIIAVGVGNDPAAADSRLTVAQVRAAIYNGQRFYTQSPSTGQTADVEPYDVVVNGRTIHTIRSSPDAIYDNNLDNLRVCSWR